MTYNTMDRRCPKCGAHDFDFMYIDHDIESGVVYYAYHEAKCNRCGKVFGYTEKYNIAGWETYDLKTGAVYTDSEHKKRREPFWARS